VAFVTARNAGSLERDLFRTVRWLGTA